MSADVLARWYKSSVPGRAPRVAVFLLIAAAGAALGAGGCTCRGRGSGPPPERFVPAAVEAALVVPEAGRAARELAALHAAVAGFPGAAELVQIRGALAAQLGFDPLDPDALAGAGLDPRRGAAVARFDRAGGPPATLLVLPIRDPSKVDELFTRIARDRLGAGQKAVESVGATSVTVFRPAPGAAPALALAVAADTALVAAGPAAPAIVSEAAARQEPESLAGSAPWKIARAALADRYAAIGFVPPGSPRLAGLWAVKDGLAVGASGSAAGVRVGMAMLLGPRAASFKTLLADGNGAALVARLDPTAPLAGRWDGDFSALGKKLVPILKPGDRARLSARGLDAQQGFDLLAPGAAAAIAFPESLDLSSVNEEALRADPLLLARFEAVLPVKDPAAAIAFSEKLAPPRRPAARAGPKGPAAGRPAAAGKGAAPQAAADPAGAEAERVFRIATGTGEIAWRVDAAARRIVVAGGPPGSLAALEARLGGEGAGFAAPTAEAKAALSGGLGGLVIDAQRLVAGVRALPEEAFGTGPSGFVVRSVVERFVEPASRLAALSLRADLAPDASALVLTLEVEGRPGGAP
jgi:hypothetical protein